MPKYSKYYKKGSYGLKQNNYSRALTTASNLHAIRMAKKAANAPLSNRGFGSMGIPQNREKKFFDISTGSKDVNTTGDFTLLHIPILGSDFNNRIGRKTLIKSIYVRGFVALKNAVSLNFIEEAPAQLGRMILFIDNQPNGAAPAVTDLLSEALSTSQLNPNNRDRFKIIKDKEFVFDPLVVSATDATGVQNRTIHPIKIYKKLNIETIFNSTNAGTIGDINTGAFYMLWIGSFNSVGGGIPEAVVSTRIRFDDV